ncbi:MAG: hypothetical protein IPH44_24715 [Myxococcales bacterium]|nr:hypothetical protein [Myxococcales bacterium]
MEAMPVLITVGLIGAVAWMALASRAKRKSVLAELAGHLGGQAGSNDVRGALDGVGVHLQLTTRGSGSSSTQWTYVDCPLPPGYPLTIHLEEHGWFDRGKIARGDMVDVEVGEPAFDEKFRVEAAPAEVVRRLLTPEVCAYLLRVGRVELATLDGNVRLAIRGWLDQADAAREAIAITVAIARGVRSAHTAADAAVARPIVGGAYRGFADESPVRAAQAARADEVAKVEAVRRQRAATRTLVLVMVMIGIGVLAAMIMAG